MPEQQQEQLKEEKEEQQRQHQDDESDRQQTQQQQQDQSPRSMQQPTPSSSTAVAVTGCAAAVVVAVVFTVVFSVLRGGVAGVLLAITFSAPAILLFLGLSVWAGARYCPLLLGFTVQVAAVEVIRLSGMMADDDDEEENESWTGMRGERRAVRIGREWAEGRLAECRHDRWRKQREGEEIAARGGGRMQRRRQRRLVVEWVDGQMFLAIHRPIASQWLVALVNRYVQYFAVVSTSRTLHFFVLVFGQVGWRTINGARCHVCCRCCDCDSFTRKLFCTCRHHQLPPLYTRILSLVALQLRATSITPFMVRGCSG